MENSSKGDAGTTSDFVPDGSNVETRIEDFTQGADLSQTVTLLREHRDEILTRWLDAAADQPFHKCRSERAVADHIPPLFDALIALLTRTKAAGHNPGVPLEDPDVLHAAQEHAQVRFSQGFIAPDIATEFRILRQEIGRALRLYVSDNLPTGEVVAAEMLIHDALDGAVFLALSALNEHEVARRKVEDLLRNSEERFRLLVESVEEYAIYTLTPDGTVDSWNNGAQRFLGYSLVEILGQPYHKLFTEADVASGLPEQLLHTAEVEGRVSGEGLRRRFDGSEFASESALTALRDEEGTLIGFAAVMHDITAKLFLAAERDAIEHERAAFFSTLGHDLKSPLASAVAISQLLRLQIERKKVLLEDVPQRLLTLEAALHRSALRVDELRDLAKKEAEDGSALNPETFDLLVLVEAILDRYRLSNEKQKFVLETRSKNVTGTWDKDRIERILDNLLSNAVKFSPGEGVITVKVALTRLAASQEPAGAVQEKDTATSDDDQDPCTDPDSVGVAGVLVTITDQGIGIPKDEQAAVFERFQRGSNAAAISGSGLGLWSAVRLATQQGGTLGLHSEEGKGSSFSLGLPLTATVSKD